ncbi:MAG: hypothetical protein M1831_004855 [Alyxoria varia]|nr:MAG: hypothetical protein M1831_004855 [Alyxoria varia]
MDTAVPVDSREGQDEHSHRMDRTRESISDGFEEIPECRKTTLPKAPNPAADPGVVPWNALNKDKKQAAEASHDDDDSSNIREDGAGGSNLSPADADINFLSATATMTILYQAVQALVDITGDVPATPPITSAKPSFANIQDALIPSSRHLHAGFRTSGEYFRPKTPPSPVPSSHDLQEVLRSGEKIGSPDEDAYEDGTEPRPSIASTTVGASTTISSSSHGAPPALPNQKPPQPTDQTLHISRKFFSKTAPPIPLPAYLQRLQTYCPMSPGVYLSAGCYIHRVSVLDKLVPVTPRTAHRLLLGTLRVAMKALEDLSYPHARFAGVGGVSGPELAKLEVAVCFLLGFELRVDMAGLMSARDALVSLGGDGSVVKTGTSSGDITLKMPVKERLRHQQSSNSSATPC